MAKKTVKEIITTTAGTQLSKAAKTHLKKLSSLSLKLLNKKK